jgi:hypothetical protein
VTEFSKQSDIICTKQAALHAKRDDSMKKVDDDGSKMFSIKFESNFCN